MDKEGDGDDEVDNVVESEVSRSNLKTIVVDKTGCGPGCHTIAVKEPLVCTYCTVDVFDAGGSCS